MKRCYDFYSKLNSFRGQFEFREGGGGLNHMEDAELTKWAVIRSYMGPDESNFAFIDQKCINSLKIYALAFKRYILVYHQKIYPLTLSGV